MNLCLNARDALDGLDRAPSSIRIAVEVLQNASEDSRAHAEAQPGPHVRVLVADNGTGMDEQTRARIYEPFFTTKEVGKGTGLGLAMVYAIIREHRGWIECESEQGEGTTFAVYLPAVEQTENLDESEALEEAVEMPPGTETILVIDDEQHVRNSVSRMLELVGYTVLQASDGMEGLALIQGDPEIDLVLLDLSMPRMSGQEVLAELRTQQMRPKVILFTGHASVLAGCGDAQAIVRKPVSSTQILQTVRAVLDEG